MLFSKVGFLLYSNFYFSVQSACNAMSDLVCSMDNGTDMGTCKQVKNFQLFIFLYLLIITNQD